MKVAAEDRVELEQLCGTRVLDGRGSFVIAPTPDDNPYAQEDAAVVVLRLDDVLYWFQEDPSDGYRSSLRFACRLRRHPQSMPPGSFVEFAPVVVEVRVRDRGDEGTGDDHVLYGVDERTGLLMFEVGTENVGDYYPCFVNRWYPHGRDEKRRGSAATSS